MKFKIPQHQFPPYPAVRDGKIIGDGSMTKTYGGKTFEQLDALGLAAETIFAQLFDFEKGNGLAFVLGKRRALVQTIASSCTPKWISVKEGLPELDVPVWCIDTTCTCGFAQAVMKRSACDDDGWLWAICETYYDLGSNDADYLTDEEYLPTHWMPLPEKPEGV